MNISFLIAGIISASACIGHFIIGKKDFLMPVLNSNIEDIPNLLNKDFIPPQSYLYYDGDFINN